jgi:hypothetical protein
MKKTSLQSTSYLWIKKIYIPTAGYWCALLVSHNNAQCATPLPRGHHNPTFLASYECARLQATKRITILLARTCVASTGQTWSSVFRWSARSTLPGHSLVVVTWLWPLGQTMQGMEASGQWCLYMWDLMLGWSDNSIFLYISNVNC